MRILLTRHGQTEANVDGRYSGITDTKLTEYGRQQAAILADEIKLLNVNRIITSNLGRTIETADVIVENLGYDVIRETNDALNERNFGIYENLYYSEVETKFGITFDQVIRDVNFRPPSGERLIDVYTRVVQYYNNVLKNLKDDTILIVAHYAPVACLLTNYNKKDVRTIPTNEVNNCQLFRI